MPYGKKSLTSLRNILLATLLSGRSTYRFKKLLNKLEQENYSYKDGSIRSALNKLSKQNYIKNTTDGWTVTQLGRKYISEVNNTAYLLSPFPKNVTKNTIVAFDIPEKNRKQRNWLRNQLKIFNYEMIQKSLWLGPGPLPQSFIEKVQYMKIRKYIKIFHIKTK